MNFDNTYVKIDLDTIAANMDTIRAHTGVPVMAVVKADAYGHGAIPVARLLRDQCAFFGVSSILEAMELRQAGIDTPILILGHTPPAAFPELVKSGIRPTIYTLAGAEAFSRAASAAGVTAPIHLAVDTGMSRIGFQAEEASAEICARIAQLPGIEIEGIFSHFATADAADLSRARAQAKRFDDFCAMLTRRGVHIPIRHMNNSAGLMNFENHYDMVRAGIVLYGMYPSEEVDPARLPLRPALSWHSRVTHVKTLPAGREISYGGTCTLDRETVVATIPVGYADGYRRSLSSRFHVLIKGKTAPILGRVCMDQLMVDVTEIPDVRSGTAVVLVGESGENGITVEEISAAADSFNYEFVCGISRRVPRLYTQGGETVHTVHYLLDT